MKTCVYCGEAVHSEDEAPDEPAHQWCAYGWDQWDYFDNLSQYEDVDEKDDK